MSPNGQTTTPVGRRTGIRRAIAPFEGWTTREIVVAAVLAVGGRGHLLGLGPAGGSSAFPVIPFPFSYALVGHLDGRRPARPLCGPEARRGLARRTGGGIRQHGDGQSVGCPDHGQRSRARGGGRSGIRSVPVEALHRRRSLRCGRPRRAFSIAARYVRVRLYQPRVVSRLYRVGTGGTSAWLRFSAW